MLGFSNSAKKCQNSLDSVETATATSAAASLLRCSLVSKRAKVCKGAFTSAFKAKGRENSLGKCSKIFLRLKHGLDFILECLLFVKIVDFRRFLAQILPECNAPDLVSPSILPSSGRTAEARKRGKNGERREIRDVASAILHLRSRSLWLVANYCKLHLRVERSQVENCGCCLSQQHCIRYSSGET